MADTPDPFAPSNDPDIPTPTRADLLPHVHGSVRDQLAAGTLDARQAQNEWAGARRLWDEGHKREAARRAAEEGKELPTIGMPSDVDSEFTGTFRDIKPLEGTRVPGQQRAPTEQEERDDRLLAFMPKQVRAAYDEAGFKERQTIWEANRRAFEAAQKREEQRLVRETDRKEKIFDMLQRIKEDPGKAHLLPPENAPMEELDKWYEEMSRPGDRPDFGTPEFSQNERAIPGARSDPKPLRPHGDQRSMGASRDPDDFGASGAATQPKQTEHAGKLQETPPQTAPVPEREVSLSKLIGAVVLAVGSLYAFIAGAFQVAGVSSVFFAHTLIVAGWLSFMASVLLIEHVLSLPRRRRVRVTIITAIVSAAFVLGMDVWMVSLKAIQTPVPSPEDPIIQRLASELEREKLLRRYDLGYAIFYVDHEDRVIPYDAEALSAYELDWSAVKLTQYPENGMVDLALPTLRQKGAAPQLFTAGLHLYGQKRVGLMNCNTVIPDSQHLERALSVCGEIIAIRGTTVVFLIGVKHLRVPA